MRLGFVALTLAGLALTGCEEEGGSAAAGGLPGKTPVVGTETCQRAVDSDEVLDDGTEVMVETFTCDTVMSDPRGSGREVLHIETTLLEEDDVSFDGSSWTKDRLGHNVDRARGRGRRHALGRCVRPVHARSLHADPALIGR